MSKQNKVNPGAYTQAGRLSPDDAARERMRQIDNASTRRLEGRPHSQLKATPSGKAETDPADEPEAEETQEEPASPREDRAARAGRQMQTKTNAQSD